MSSIMVSKENIRGQLAHLGRQFVLYQAQISRLLTLVFIALIAWVIGVLIWVFLTPTSLIGQWSAPVVSSRSTAISQTSDISPLLNANLFGVYTQTQAPKKEAVVQDAPQTRLNLTLVGAVSSSNEQLSLAIIANQGKQATYGIDETIENTRVTLKAVFVDRVIIRNQGRDETLMLQGIDYNKTPQTIPEKNNQPPIAQEDNLTVIREEIASDPQKIFQYIRLSQVMEEGKLKGYRVRPGSQRELFDQVGLKDGDIATVLNGKDLTDPSQMASLWKDAVSLSEWNLTVERDGQIHDIYIQF
ncbi:type II secretion system protein GspC [Vibrio casei]|uniref:type II secretion system protein GspC n=1 Tax=Vibrio casei TaxID=673372 RepID=UPI003F99217A